MSFKENEGRLPRSPRHIFPKTERTRLVFETESRVADGL